MSVGATGKNASSWPKGKLCTEGDLFNSCKGVKVSYCLKVLALDKFRMWKLFTTRKSVKKKYNRILGTRQGKLGNQIKLTNKRFHYEKKVISSDKSCR